jgi:cyclophilin family peptidyl-prolyl cis-trans isomerase
LRWGTTALAAALLAASLLAACGDDDGGGGDEQETAVLTQGCGSVPPPPDREVQPPKGDFELTSPATAVVQTSEGDFEIELATDRAPKTTGSFAHLVEQGFYDGLEFHRIEPGFVIQGGDPLSGTPQVGSGGPGYCVEEPPPEDQVYSRGTVAMAKTEVEPPGFSGSQFFVVTSAADAGLPPDYALVGQVTKGMDTVMAIEGLGAPGGEPQRPVTIDRITLRKG